MNGSITTLALATVLVAASAATAATPAQQCEASKNKIAGTYYACRVKAEASAILKGTSPDYGRCVEKFDDKWDAAEARGDGSCPDDAPTAEMNTFLAGQATVTAGILAGTAVPSCGDGSINVPGEHCDGADLGNATCAELSYIGGVLACDASCRFDTTGCDCPAGSKRVNGICWTLAASSEGPQITNCNDACASLGLTCNETALQSIGSSGTGEACRAMADIVNPASAPHAGSVPVDMSTCGAATDLAAGCMTYPDQFNEDVAVQALHSGSPTRCDADMDPMGCLFYPSLFRRVCACNP